METKLKILFTVLFLTFIQLFCTNNLLAQNNKNKPTEKLLNLTESLDSTDINLDDFTQAIKAGADVNAFNNQGLPPLISIIKYYQKQDIKLKSILSISIFPDEYLLEIGGGVVEGGHIKFNLSSWGTFLINGKKYTTRDLQLRIDEKNYIKKELETAKIVCKLLVANGADTEWKFSDEKTYLIKAIVEHNYDLISFVLTIGANISSANNYFTTLSTTKSIKKLLENNGATFIIRDVRYNLKEPYAVELGWTILGMGDFFIDTHENSAYDPSIGIRPDPSIALRTGLNLSITPAYKFKINNEIFFVYKGVGNYDIMDIVYSPTLRYYFAPGDYYFSGGIEYNYNLSYKLIKSAQSNELDNTNNNSSYEQNTEDFGVNKSTFSPCIGIGMDKRKIVLELRYKKDLSEYYTHYHKKQSSFYLLFGIKF